MPNKRKLIDLIARARAASAWAMRLARRVVYRFCHCLESPWYSPQVVLARQIVNSTTIIWSAIVLLHDDSLVTAHAPYSWITEYVNENLVAGAFGLLGVTQFIWLWCRLRPRKMGGSGYGVLALFWGFVAFSIYFSSAIIFPTAGSLVPVIYALSLYAFISIPKVRTDAHP